MQCEELEPSWRRPVDIPDDQLHTIGQSLCGLSCRVPVYDKGMRPKEPAIIDEDTLNTFFKITKAKMNGTVVAESLRVKFTYRPGPLQTKSVCTAW